MNKLIYKLNLTLIIILVITTVFTSFIIFYISNEKHKQEKLKYLDEMNIDLSMISEKIIANLILSQNDVVEQLLDKVEKKHLLASIEYKRIPLVSLDNIFKDLNYAEISNILHISYPLKYLGNNYGFINVKTRIDNKNLVSFKPLMMNLFVPVVFFAIIFMFFFLAFFLRHKVTIPITLLAKQLKPIAKGEYNIELNYHSNDEVGYLYNAINDIINELKRYQLRFEQQSKLAAIGQTTSMLAHDVRKPFSQIKIILNMMDKIKNDPSLLKKAKDDVDRSINNVESMISDILDFSREVKLETEPTPITSLLGFSIRECAQCYPNSEISISYDIQNEKMPLVDGQRITRVFSNIIGNGIEAIRDIGKRDTGKIEIRVRKGASAPEHRYTSRKDQEGWNFVEISISNDGPAINEEDIPKLFEPFFTKGKRRGTGLGLASCQKIVNLHGGNISVRNNFRNIFNRHSRESGNPDMDPRFHGDDSAGSNNNTGVEFIIALPASDKNELHNVEILPTNI